MRQTLPWRRCTPALIWSDVNELWMSQSVWSLRETSQINQWGSWKTQKWEELWTKVVKEEQRQKWKLCDDEHVTNLKLRHTALKPRCSLGVWSWNSSVFVWKERRKSAAADSNSTIRAQTDSAEQFHVYCDAAQTLILKRDEVHLQVWTFSGENYSFDFNLTSYLCEFLSTLIIRLFYDLLRRAQSGPVDTLTDPTLNIFILSTEAAGLFLYCPSFFGVIKKQKEVFFIV